MKFKTKRTSETGKKFAIIEDRLQQSLKASQKLAKELGAKDFREAYWVAGGGISSLVFPHDFTPPPYYKKVNHSSELNEWMPKLNIKAGKEIMERINALPRVGIGELNKCIGFQEDMFKTIGFNMMNEEYFLFSAEEEWLDKLPADCEEITVGEYNALAENKELV